MPLPQGLAPATGAMLVPGVAVTTRPKARAVLCAMNEGMALIKGWTGGCYNAFLCARRGHASAPGEKHLCVLQEATADGTNSGGARRWR